MYSIAGIKWIQEDIVTLFTTDGLIQIGGSLIPHQLSAMEVIIDVLSLLSVTQLKTPQLFLHSRIVQNNYPAEETITWKGTCQI